ncbi:hypothetical protein N0V88_004577 [Collariella sp. IMI 366227]|nr:hypothetical protein N0V88_004577 [Collariella sp. IMI 366227]
MSSCSLGVNAFRSGVQVAALHLSRPGRLVPAAPFSTRCFSSWPSARQQRPQQKRHNRAPTTSSHALLKQRPTLLPQWPGARTLMGGFFVPVHYVDIPPNYKDKDGLPFASRELETDEVLVLFGPHISTMAGNRLLRILHGRRVAGTLDDPSLRINTMEFAMEHQKLALEYLRRTLPVDEIANAGLRAEDELAALENLESADQQTDGASGSTSKLKLYKDAEPAKKDSVYGVSALDAVRAHNKAKWEAELKRREEEKKKLEAEEKHGVAGPLTVGGKIQMPPLSVKMQEYMVKGQSDLKEPPKMAAWERLLPSILFVSVVVGFFLTYALLYIPPTRENRLWPDVPPAAATVGMLILANVAVWALWKIPPFWGFLNKYMLVIAGTPRAANMLAAVFSHQSFSHLVQNMIGLWFLGVRLHDDVGRGAFLATYFSSGMLASLGTLTLAVLRNRLDIASLGASGAIYGVAAAYLWLHRFEHFRVLGLPPPPSEGFQGLTFLALLAAVNIGGFFTMKRFTVDITAHLVGLGVGICAAHKWEQSEPRRSAAAVNRVYKKPDMEELEAYKEQLRLLQEAAAKRSEEGK